MYYEIDEKTARVGHEMMSFREYKDGSATAEYRASVDSAAALVEAQKQKVSPYYHDRLDAMLDRYARRLAEWTNAYNRNRASCPSIMICGGSNFPTRKKERQNAHEGTLWNEYKDIQGILDSIKALGTGPVDLADPYAREILTERVEKLQAELERGKAMNAHYRKHKTMQGFPGLTDESAARMDADLSAAPAFARSPYPDYELTSLRGKIKRAQERLAELENLEERHSAPDAETEFDGGRIFRNAIENRLQLFFDGKPDEETREALKKHGFRWSPKNKAWQRQLTDNAERAARLALNLPDEAPAPAPTASADDTPAENAAPVQVDLFPDGQGIFSGSL